MGDNVVTLASQKEFEKLRGEAIDLVIDANMRGEDVYFNDELITHMKLMEWLPLDYNIPLLKMLIAKLKKHTVIPFPGGK